MWLPPTGDEQSMLKYYVEFQEDGELSSTQKTVYTNWTTLNLGPNRWYTIRVQAINQDKKGGPWSDAFRILSNESSKCLTQGEGGGGVKR